MERLINICLPPLGRPLLSLWHGGMTTIHSILVSLAWPWTTSRSLVCHICLLLSTCSHVLIAATSVEVEHCFSHGRIIVNHLYNRLSAQTTRALMCLNYWNRAGLVQDDDILKIIHANEPVEGDIDEDMAEGWDAINSLDIL